MNTESTDKTFSTILYLLSVMAIFYGLTQSNSILFLEGWILKDIIYLVANSYNDILIIGYVFICLQISGYIELKYGKDYLTISILSILLTPISLFFILFDKNDD